MDKHVGDLLECERCRGTGTMWIGPEDYDRCDECDVPGVRRDAPVGDWPDLEELATAIEANEAVEVDGEIVHPEVALWLLVRWFLGRELTPAERWPNTEAA